MESYPLHEKGGDLSTILGVQLLWLGPILLWMGLPALVFQVESIYLSIVNGYLTGYPDIMFDYWFIPLTLSVTVTVLGYLFTGAGVICVSHWYKLYRLDLAWERKMGYLEG